MQTAPDAELHRLLDRSAAFAPEYGRTLSSHLPMALQALHALGAPASRLSAFFERHARALQPRAPAAAPAHPADWTALRGRHGDLPADAAFESLAAMFAAQIGLHGPDAVLAAAVPRLVDGVAGAAFHGLLRTAHAVAARHEGELALGLAYWAARWTPLHPAAGDGGTLSPADWLAALRALPAPAEGGDAFLITDRMRAWAATPGFRAVAPALRLDARTLDTLAATAAALYAASRDFTVLHMVTAAQAMRTLQPWWGDEARALRQFSIAAAAALRASGAAAVLPTEARHAAPPPWPAIVAAAVADDDEHVVKLVEACRRHEAATGDAVFRAAAAAAVPAAARAGQALAQPG